MNKELAKTLTLALVNYIDENRPEGTMDCSSGECVSLEKAFTEENFDSVETLINKKFSRLTEFELRLLDWLSIDTSGEVPMEKMTKVVKNRAAILLDLAREQFIKDGYVIEKKAFYDAVENISDKHLAEMSVEYSIHCKVEDGTRHAVMNWEAFQKVAQKFINIGKAEALKDLPRWRRWENGACGNSDNIPIAIVKRGIDYKLVSSLGIQGEQYIMLSDLEKLPGFNN